MPGMTVPGTSMMAPGPPGLMPPMYSAEQLMWMQQAYAQYMAQYMH